VGGSGTNLSRESRGGLGAGTAHTRSIDASFSACKLNYVRYPNRVERAKWTHHSKYWTLIALLEPRHVSGMAILSWESGRYKSRLLPGDKQATGMYFTASV